VSTSRAAEVVEFYRTLGLPLVEEDHGDGAQHWACDVDDIHLAVLATDGAGDAPSYHEPGSTFCGFVVDDVSALTERPSQGRRDRRAGAEQDAVGPSCRRARPRPTADRDPRSRALIWARTIPASGTDRAQIDVGQELDVGKYWSWVSRRSAAEAASSGGEREQLAASRARENQMSSIAEGHGARPWAASAIVSSV
jgi:hypothetical protein